MQDTESSSFVYAPKFGDESVPGPVEVPEWKVAGKEPITNPPTASGDTHLTIDQVQSELRQHAHAVPFQSPYVRFVRSSLEKEAQHVSPDAEDTHVNMHSSSHPFQAKIAQVLQVIRRLVLPQRMHNNNASPAHTSNDTLVQTPSATTKALHPQHIGEPLKHLK